MVRKGWIRVPGLSSDPSVATSEADPKWREQWMVDFEAAKAIAKAEKKDLLIDFTGSDWCVWCIRLSNEVFQYKEFSEAALEKFVLVELDYPNDKSHQPESIQQQNARLEQQFMIQGYPTIILADSDGRPTRFL